MNRRRFIKIIGASCVVLAAPTIVTHQLSPSDDLKLRPTHTYDDIRKTLLSYAMLSANPHNTQAWKVALPRKDTILLYVDPDRLLPETDPIYRQIHIGQGAFIESLVIAASHFGIGVHIDYFPQGEYDNQSLESKPVASITLISEPTIAADPLFHYLNARQSTKTPYAAEAIPRQQLNYLNQTTNNSTFQLRFVDAASDNGKMSDFLTRSMIIEEQNISRSLETISMFRFNDEEMVTQRDGFGLAQNGVTGTKRWITERLFISREQAEADPQSFGKEGIKLTQEVANNAPHFGLLISDSNSRLDQIKAGRIYQRTNLVTASIGLVQHPMSQILQEYQDMLPLQAEFKKHYEIQPKQTVQMLFRLGNAPLTPPSPRREVNDIVLG
ncbi:twin-arginine translocation pathway signal protein [Vibrio tubiashii]|nr:twin-arginine translocation pathway signal protein [Vibrio tubiashii]